MAAQKYASDAGKERILQDFRSVRLDTHLVFDLYNEPVFELSKHRDQLQSFFRTDEERESVNLWLRSDPFWAHHAALKGLRERRDVQKTESVYGNFTPSMQFHSMFCGFLLLFELCH
jgi:hypothetical protein